MVLLFRPLCIFITILSIGEENEKVSWRLRRKQERTAMTVWKMSIKSLKGQGLMLKDRWKVAKGLEGQGN